MNVTPIREPRVSFGAKLDARNLSRYLFMNNWNSQLVKKELDKFYEGVYKLGTKSDSVNIESVRKFNLNNEDVLIIEGLVNNNRFHYTQSSDVAGLKGLKEHLSQFFKDSKKSIQKHSREDNVA